MWRKVIKFWKYYLQQIKRGLRRINFNDLLGETLFKNNAEYTQCASVATHLGKIEQKSAVTFKMTTR